MYKIIIAAVLMAILPCSAALAFGSLSSQRISGFDRFCFYSDGGAITVGSTELCPISNMASPGTVTIKRSFGFGAVQGAGTVRGFSRVCRYSNGDVLTVGSTDLCPISSN